MILYRLWTSTINAFIIVWFSMSLIPLYGKEVTCGGMCSYSSALRTKCSLTKCPLMLWLLANLGDVQWQVVVSPHHPHQWPRWQAMSVHGSSVPGEHICDQYSEGCHSRLWYPLESSCPVGHFAIVWLLATSFCMWLPQQYRSFNLTGFWPRLSEPINMSLRKMSGK